MRFDVVSVSTGIGFVVLLVVAELVYIIRQLPAPATLGSSALASMMVHPRNLVLSAVAFIVGVFIANRLIH